MSGEVPEGWTSVTLGEVIRLEYGRALAASAREPGAIPVYGSNGICGEHSAALVKERGIVVGRKGTAGSVNVTTGPFWPIDTTYYVVPRVESDFDWLAATLEYARLSELNEATGVPGLNRDKAYGQRILLPPLKEQRRIAEVLRSVDDAHRLNDLSLTHLRLLRKLALRDLFTAADGEEPEDTILGPLPHGWAAIPAEDICEAVIDCKNRTPPITETGFAVVRTPNVRHGRFVRHNLVRTDPASFDEWTRRGRPRVGDVLITREAPIGEVCAVPHDEPVCLGQRMMLYRPQPTKLDSSFLLYALQSQPVQDHLRILGGGSTVGHVRVGDIRQLPIPCPPLATQITLAKMLEEIDLALDRAAESRAQTGDLKSSLASDLLSGRVRVPA